MSKCQVQITFDRNDRQYRGGEAVRGLVRIVVNEEVKGKGIRLTHRWRTHGRGNTDSGPEEVITLAGPQLLMAGEQLEFPFEVTAPTYPMSYRGHLIYVDHYIRVDVDVPWARNPWSEEEYVLRPGQTPPQLTGQRDKVISLKPEAVQMGWFGKTILMIIGVALLALLAAFALFLIPIVLIGSAIWWIRKTAVASRVGTVEVSMPHRIVAPGEQWPVSVRFTARKSFLINSVSVQIKGQETAGSGSGSNKKTHTHDLDTKRHIVRESGLLSSGEMVDETIHMTFPETNAFSFDQPDNKIKWTAEVRIDIPKFPDWSKSEELQVVPIEFLGDQAKLPDGTTGSGQTTFPVEEPSWYDERHSEDDEDDDDLESDEDESTEYPPSGLADAKDSKSSFARPDTIQELIQQLASVDRHDTQRSSIVANAATEIYDVSVVIDRISTSIGTLQTEADYANGKTIVGLIEGTQQSIEIVTPEAANSELESFRRGDVWQSTVNVLSWDTLYNRIRARHVE